MSKPVNKQAGMICGCTHSLSVAWQTKHFMDGDCCHPVAPKPVETGSKAQECEACDDVDRAEAMGAPRIIVARCVNCNQDIPQHQNSETPYLERAATHLRYGHDVREVSR